MNSLLCLSRGLAGRRLPLLTRVNPLRSLSTHNDPHSLYTVLGVRPDATQLEIKSAFYDLSKIYHPDVTQEEVAKAKFVEVSEAYEILGNPRLRHNYDRGLLVPKPGVHHDAGPLAEMMKTGGLHGGVERKHRQTKAPPEGYSDMYDFDEFYRRLYKERIIQSRAQKFSKESGSGDDMVQTLKLLSTNSILVGLLLALCGAYSYNELVNFFNGKFNNKPRKVPFLGGD